MNTLTPVPLDHRDIWQVVGDGQQLLFSQEIAGISPTVSYYHRKFIIVMFAWAAVITFSWVFLGLHYFTDVIGGASLGFVVS
jgi:membrane-associated phospholipid phosphatase